MADHSLQANTPLSYSASAMAKACASQGARKTGPLSSRGIPGTASAALRAASGWINFSGMFEIGLKRFDGNLQLWVRIRTPKVPRVEAHRVKPLRIVAFAGRYRIG